MSDIENIIKEVENVKLKKALFSKGFECYGFIDKTAEEVKTEILDILKEHLEEAKAIGNPCKGCDYFADDIISYCRKSELEGY